MVPPMPEELEWGEPKLLSNYTKFTPLLIFFSAIKLPRVEFSFSQTIFLSSRPSIEFSQNRHYWTFKRDILVDVNGHRLSYNVQAVAP